MLTKIKFIIIVFVLVLFLSALTIIALIQFYGPPKIYKFKDENHKYHYIYKMKEKIKFYLFPYRVISNKDQIIFNKNLIINSQNDLLRQYQYINSLEPSSPYHRYELLFKKNLSDITAKKIQVQDLSDDLVMTTHKNLKGFYSGIKLHFPGSGYLDFHNENLIILSSKGLLGYQVKDNKNLLFKQIKNNIEEFINEDQFQQRSNNIWEWFSIKDLTIINNEIYISYTEEIENHCWNTSIISADMNYKNIKFKKFYSSKKCILDTSQFNDISKFSKARLKNPDLEFNAHQSGGRIVKFDENNILFSVGDFRNRSLAQDKLSINGKIIKININNKKIKIISMGHRNPQGLFYDKENNFILETEHGPAGGDEINLIKFNNKNYIPNYGWAIASYGEHYGGRSDSNKNKYKKYPLLKSHNKNGFIEPLHYFIPSIGIQEIKKISGRNYVVSSLRAKSLYFFSLNEKNKLVNLKKIEVHERIRDIAYNNHKLYLFLENSASLGIIDLKNFIY